MDYEKKYKEALERARIWKDKSGMPKDKQGILDDIFPELKESEEERIRKELITHCRNTRCVTEEGAERIAKWIAWLEKQGEKKSTDNMTQQEAMDIAVAKCFEYGEQKSDNKVELKFKHGDRVRNKKSGLEQTLGSCIEDVYEGAFPFRIKDQDEWKLVEQKPTDKVEPKFNVGDWITNGHCTCQITFIDSRYWLSETHVLGNTTSIDKTFHLWSINDAKDGDILTGKIDGDSYILIFKQIKDGWMETYGHYYDSVDRFCVPSQLFCRDYQGTFIPANKEQRDLLFKKIHEAGYMWDSDSKQLLSLKAEPNNEKKLAWSEEAEAPIK